MIVAFSVFLWKVKYFFSSSSSAVGIFFCVLLSGENWENQKEKIIPYFSVPPDEFEKKGEQAVRYRDVYAVLQKSNVNAPRAPGGG